MSRAGWAGEIVGHRGAAGLAPENTLASFEAALEAGCDRIELDVRATRDGAAVVFHDARLDRFVTAASPLQSTTVTCLTLAELERVDVGAALGRPGCHVPSLRAALDLLDRRVALNIELKGSGDDGSRALRACLPLLRERGLQDMTLLSSFHAPVLQEAREQAPEVPRAFIADDRTPGDAVVLARDLVCVALHAGHEITDEPLLARCRSAGLALRTWTVNDEARMRRFMALGVDGIVTDHPDRLRACAGR